MNIVRLGVINTADISSFLCQDKYVNAKLNAGRHWKMMLEVLALT